MSEEVKLVLRLPAELHERIKRLAEQDRRSLNGQILHILEQYDVHREQGTLERAALLAQITEQVLEQLGQPSARRRIGTLRPPRKPADGGDDET